MSETISTLYDSLREQALNNSSSRLPWSTIDSSLKRSKIGLEQRQTIYVLMLEHYFRTEQSLGIARHDVASSLKKLPYGGSYIDKRSKRGCRFSIDSLPPILRDIINVYLTFCLEA